MLLQRLNELLDLQVAFDLGMRQAEHVAAVDAQVARAVEVHFAREQAVDDDDVLAVDRHLALVAQLTEELAHGDHDIGRILAEVFRVIPRRAVDGRAAVHLVGVRGEVVDGLVHVHAGDGEHERRRLDHAGILLAFLIAGAGEVGHVAVAGRVDKDLRSDRDLIPLAAQADGAQRAVVDIHALDLGVQQDFDTRVEHLMQGDELEDLMVI